MNTCCRATRKHLSQAEARYWLRLKNDLAGVCTHDRRGSGNETELTRTLTFTSGVLGRTGERIRLDRNYALTAKPKREVFKHDQLERIKMWRKKLYANAKLLLDRPRYRQNSSLQSNLIANGHTDKQSIWKGGDDDKNKSEFFWTSTFTSDILTNKQKKSFLWGKFHHF